MSKNLFLQTVLIFYFPLYVFSLRFGSKMPNLKKKPPAIKAKNFPISYCFKTKHVN